MVIKVKETPEHIDNPELAFKLFKSALEMEDKIDQEKEHFYVLHLDSRNHLKLLELVAVGTLNGALVHPREVFRRAIVEGAAKIIIAHNHPSNDPTPSEDDIALTRRLADVGRIVDIEIQDHIIFTLETFTSLKSKNIF